MIEGESAIRSGDRVIGYKTHEAVLIPPDTLHRALPYGDKPYLALRMSFEPGKVSGHFAGIDNNNAFFASGYFRLNSDCFAAFRQTG